MPVFLRFVEQMDITGEENADYASKPGFRPTAKLFFFIPPAGTFKIKKLALQREGYNPAAVSDPLYFFDGAEYVKLDQQLYQKIADQKVRL